MLHSNTSISLDEHSSDFVNAAVRDGRYESMNEMVRAGLRMLREALVAGEESGPLELVDFDEFINEKRQMFNVAQ